MYFKEADNVKSDDPRRDSILSMNKYVLGHDPWSNESILQDVYHP